MTRVKGRRLHQPEPPADRRLEASVGVAVTEPTQRSGHKAVGVGGQRCDQRIDAVGVQADIVVQQQGHGTVQGGHHVVERAESPVRLADDRNLRKPLAQPRQRVVGRVVIDHRNAATIPRVFGGREHRRQTLGQQPTTVVVQDEQVYEHRPHTIRTFGLRGQYDSHPRTSPSCPSFGD